MTLLLSRLRSLALTLLMALAGTAATSTDAQAFNCPSSQVKEGALCYAKPRAGYSCHATLCVANCPDGYRSSGIGTCHYAGTLTYTQKPYLTRSHSNMQRCLALFYNNCRSGYRMNVCGICSYGGAWDTTRHSYDRGPGSNPDANAAFRRISDTTRAAWGTTLQGVEAGFNDVVNALAQFERDMLGQLSGVAKSTAQQVAGAHSCFIDGVKQKLVDGVIASPEMVNTVKRALVDAGSRRGTEQTLADVRAIAHALNLSTVLARCDDVPEVFKMPFTLAIYTGYQRAAGYGVNGAVGLMFTIDPKAPAGALSTPEVRAFVSGGNVYGPAAGNEFEIGLSMQPGKPSSQTGKYFGFSGSVTDVGGGTVGLFFDKPLKFPPDIPANLFNVLDPEAAVKTWLAEFMKSLEFNISIGATSGSGGGTTFETGVQTTFLLVK